MLSPALTAATGPATTGALLCAVSLAASRQDALAPTALQVKLPKIPEIPKISLPKVPKLPDINLDLPNFGKKSDAPAPKAKAPTVPRTPTAPGARVKVRAANAVIPSNPDAPSAPTLSDITAGAKKNDGWKRYPARRMPGANMGSFKEMAKGMKIGPGMK